MKRSLPTLLLCVLLTAPAFGGLLDSPREFSSRFRDRVIKIIEVVTNGDALTPPKP